MQSETEKLTESVDGLAKNISQGNSMRFVFLRGIFFGLGSAIGASVIAAIIIGILARLAHLFNIAGIWQ